MELENSSANSGSAEASVSSSGQPPAHPPAKKKRNLAGMPDPEAEVIALSPKSLLATNRFVCEICNKGFQRDQNLQLHRRGHNLPWKLRQGTGKQPRKRVYVCPEAGCVHHAPARALGDLTGIKKHFSRKHGEKRWPCAKCAKKYAVLSDYKAHARTCGTREYSCDSCATLFSRRDSFVTHRAFCDALAEESGKIVGGPAASPVKEVEPSEEEEDRPENPSALQQPYISPPIPETANTTTNTSQNTTLCTAQNTSTNTSICTSILTKTISPNLQGSTGPTSSTTPSLFASFFTSPGPGPPRTGMNPVHHEPPSLCLSTSPLYPQPIERRQLAPAAPSPHMSATALLQKAAQMGATSSSSSFLKGFNLDLSSPNPNSYEWAEPETAPMLSAGLGLGLGLGSENGPIGLPNFMMSNSGLFGPKPATLDLLGLGMGPSLEFQQMGGGMDSNEGFGCGTTQGG